MTGITNTMWIVGSCALGFAVTMIVSRELLEQIEAHLGRRHRRERAYWETLLVSAREQVDLLLAERNKWKLRFRMAENTAIATNQRLIADIRALQNKLPRIIPRTIDASEKIHRELAGDGLHIVHSETDSIDVDQPDPIPGLVKLMVN